MLSIRVLALVIPDMNGDNNNVVKNLSKMDTRQSSVIQSVIYSLASLYQQVLVLVRWFFLD